MPFVTISAATAPGDFDEADESIEHNPVVEEGMPCICLVALQGGIELQSLGSAA